MRAQGHMIVYRRPADGVSYELVPSVAHVSARADGTVTTGAITLSAYKREGAVRSANLLDSLLTVGNDYYAEYSVDGGTWTAAAYMQILQGLQVLFAYGIQANAVATVREGLGLRLRHADDGGTPLLTVPALQLVRDGKQGMDGCIHRTSEWAEGFEYHNDRDATDTWPRYIDTVLITDAAGKVKGRWTCIKTHGPSDADNRPVAGGNEWWEPLNDMAPLYTPLILADNAVIRMTQTNELIIVNDDGVVALHLGKGRWPLWIGADNPDDAPYKVDITGALHSTKATITGDITATSGKVGDWVIRNGLITSESDGDGGTYMRLDASSPMIAMGRDGGEMSYVSPDGILANWAGVDAVPSFDVTHLGAVVGMGRGDLDTLPGLDPLANVVAGVYGVADNAGTAESYGGYFEGLMASGLSLRPLAVGDGETVYMDNGDTMVVGLAGTSAATVYLPQNPRYGQVHFFKQWAGDSMFVKPQGKHKIRQNQNAISQYQISGGHWAMVTFFRTVDRAESIDGVWLVTGV